ncbi:MAG: hypothetical protein IKN09_04945, partial [Clostridia bacterium]|nr:hypothetical protein [Clostridia bacterium]
MSTENVNFIYVQNGKECIDRTKFRRFQGINPNEERTIKVTYGGMRQEDYIKKDTIDWTKLEQWKWIIGFYYGTNTIQLQSYGKLPKAQKGQLRYFRLYSLQNGTQLVIDSTGKIYNNNIEIEDLDTTKLETKTNSITLDRSIKFSNYDIIIRKIGTIRIMDIQDYFYDGFLKTPRFKSKTDIGKRLEKIIEHIIQLESNTNYREVRAYLKEYALELSIIKSEKQIDIDSIRNMELEICARISYLEWCQEGKLENQKREKGDKSIEIIIEREEEKTLTDDEIDRQVEQVRFIENPSTSEEEEEPQKKDLKFEGELQPNQKLIKGISEIKVNNK